MKKLLIIIISLSFITACGGYKTGVLEKETDGYIQFLGNTANAFVQIGDSVEFYINPETDLYKLKPGQYLVKVYKNDKLVIERTLIIQSQNTIELEVP